MKKLINVFIITFFSFLLFGCTKEEWQQARAGANCDTNRTAVVVFENRSSSGLTYDVLWNNVRVATLKPGEKTKAEAYATGVNNYTFRKTGTSTNTCSPGYPNLAQCNSYTFWCNK